MNTIRLSLLTLLLVFGGVVPLYGQARVDSLEARLSRVRGVERLAVVVELLKAHQAADPKQALTYGREALALLRRYPDPQREARVWYWTALAHDKVSQYDSVLVHAGRLRALARSTEQAQGLADAAYLEGLAHWRRGAYEQAIAASSDALARYEALEDRRGTAAALNDIGLAHWRQGRYEEAQGFFERSLALKEALGDSSGVAWALNNVGLMHQELGDPEAAIRYFERSLAIKEEIGDEEGAAWTLGNIGTVYQNMGQFDAAHDSLFTTESQSVIAELQEQYRAKEQRQRIELLQREREIQRLWVGGLGGGTLLLLLVAGLLYSRYRLKSRSHTLLAKAHEELQQSHERLKATQQQLLHAEKMASLGALTAGIAHEIKNPLNFVNNFSQLTGELLEELSETLRAHRQTLPAGVAAEVDALVADVRLNATKIEEHGQRADGIVRAMMQHARGTEGERDAVDLNKLIEEYVGLAYHGMRAQVPDFNVEIAQDYGEDVGSVELVPQEIGRVLLNLLHNAFYAVHEQQARIDERYQPRVTVCTMRTGRTVELRIGDNGPGIPEALRQKIFEPFFTTKPTGEGTGLGLSLSYDIVTQGHGGRLTVESKQGQGTTFHVVLPADPAPL